MAGHPKFSKAAVFDIISPDLESGPLAAGGEIISVADHCLDSFPNLSQNYEIHISHSKSELDLSTLETSDRVPSCRSDDE